MSREQVESSQLYFAVRPWRLGPVSLDLIVAKWRLKTKVEHCGGESGALLQLADELHLVG